MNENKENLKSFLINNIQEITLKSKGKDQYICPFCGSGTGSNGTGAFTYYPETQTYNCFKCSENGDIFTLYAKMNNLDCNTDFPKIVDELAKKYGISETSANPTAKQREHAYKNADGSIFAKKVIIKYPDGKKKAFWTLFDNEKGEFSAEKGLAGQKAPLYNADMLHKNESTVFITEGEKDADLLVKWGFVATTVPNGAGFSNWINLYDDGLQNRDVVIITDNDDSGRNMAKQLRKMPIKSQNQ